MPIYTVQIPPTWHLGAYTLRLQCTLREVRRLALAEHNESLARKGRPPVARLPALTSVRWCDPTKED